MRNSLFLIGSTVASVAFQLTVLIWPQEFQRLAWAVKYVWVACAVIWMVWIVTYPGISRALHGVQDPDPVGGGYPVINISPAISPTFSPVQSNIQGTSNREHRKRPQKARLHVQARPEITVDCFIGTGHPRFSVWNNSDTLAVNVQVINLEHNSMTMLFAPVPRVAKGQEELLEFHIEGAPMNAAHTLEGFVALLGKEAVSLPFVVHYENLDGHKFIANHRLDWSPPRIDLTFIPPLVQA